jgi:Uncharacterized protein conserved in bacteria
MMLEGVNIVHVVAAVVAIIVICILLILRSKAKKSKPIEEPEVASSEKKSDAMSGISVRSHAMLGGRTQDQVGAMIARNDADFSAELFVDRARDVFMQLQQAWTDRDWRELRSFESNELFDTHKAQLDEYKENHKINAIEGIEVSHCALVDYASTGESEMVMVELHAKMRDYVVDDATREVLESNPDTDWSMRYLMTFSRVAGIKTQTGSNGKPTTVCPNCGAPMQVTLLGECEYCNVVITTGEYDWVLSGFKKE